MILPNYVLTILNRLRKSDFEAYAVGGCVRDILLGKMPSDWDICTSALPQQIISALSDFKTIPTGIKHGTITVLCQGNALEVTTFRIDGKYSDNRRPDKVTFTSRLEDDLIRRDFTVNAMAYGSDGEIIDPLGGKQDLESGILRCVGDAETRFCEDALRIMRALRFAAAYGFRIEPQTEAALESCKHLLGSIASERIATELNKLIVAPYCSDILRKYSHILGEVIPEILPAVGFEQDNPNHCYDVWEHTLHAIENSPPKLPVRLALLFHDLGKPLCATQHKSGFTYFPSHPDLSSDISAKALRRLKYDNETRHTVQLLTKIHDIGITPDKVSVKKMLNRIGCQKFVMLMDVKIADNSAKNPDHLIHYNEALEVMEIYKAIMQKGECFSLKALNINGNDIIKHTTLTNKDIGKALNFLLKAVIEEKCPNKKSDLIEYLKDKF